MPKIIPLGDSCLSVVFDERIDPAVNARCLNLADAIERLKWPAIRDVVPGFHTVAVYFNSLELNRQRLSSELDRLADREPRVAETLVPPLEIPVRYGSEAGPDLPDVAAFAGCSQDDVIRIHTSTVYRVYMLGFLPGFAYLGSVDERIAMPRLDAPRMRVPAGSVGIAGMQTGIYPCDSPGGWRIVGHSAVQPFDAAKSDFLFKPGQRVQFIAE